MKKIIKYYIPVSVLIALVILFFQPDPFLRKALIYNTVDIDDHQLFSNRIIESGPYQPWKLSPKYNSYHLSKDDLNLLMQYQTVAFIVIKDTNLVFESYWEDYSENTLSSSFSMAKSFVSLLLGIALDEGLISSIDDPVEKYIPEFKGKKYTITIRDLLTMSSGLEWNESYHNPFSVTTKSYYGKNLDKLVLKCKSEYPPAEKYKYIAANPQLLSIIIKNVTNKTLSQYFSEKIWKPLGAKNDASWSLDEEGGSEKASCCFNSNARDFARIGQLILHKGSWNNQQIVSKSYLNEALNPASYLLDENNQAVDFYGFQWWISNYNKDNIYYARGILGQYIISIPNKNMVIVRLGHKRSKDQINHHPIDLFKYLDLAYQIIE